MTPNRANLNVSSRGGKPRYWEEVAVGDLVGPVIKGPLTVTDCICFLMGFGYLFVRAHRQWHEFRRSHPSAGIKNSRGIWDVPERVHWPRKPVADCAIQLVLVLVGEW